MAAGETMWKVVQSVGKKPLLSVSLVVDLLTTAASLVMGVYCLASLPHPFPPTYVKVSLVLLLATP
jgi:hypothetical protein